jgi:two-component sensor histidine kinase
MKGVSAIKKIIYSSWFLAGIPSILIILFLPSLGSKYRLQIVQSANHDGQYCYSDLNSDGISELVYSSKAAPFSYIVARNVDNLIYDQWNISDYLDQDISDFFFGDFDHDRLEEIYVFSHNKDSLFLNINEILDPSGTRQDRIFITKIGYLNSEVSSILMPAGFVDEDGDGIDELYFTITSDFQLGPRRLYRFDIVHKSLKSSQVAGSTLLNPKMTDADGDQAIEIFGSMSASGNYRANFPYSDSSTWFMVFDDKLNFKFPPVEFPGFANGLEVYPYESGSFKGYILSHLAHNADNTVLKSRIMIYSSDGKLIRYRLYSDFGMSGPIQVFTLKFNKSDKIYVIKDKFLELNDQLEIVRTVDLPFNSRIFTYQADLDGNGEDEFLLYSEDEEKLAVYSTELHKLTEQEFKTPDHVWTFSKYYSGNQEYKLYLSSGGSGYFLKLQRNKYYYLGYLSFPAIYFLFLMFIIFIKKINTLQVVQKESLKRKLVTLQLQGIKSQLDPHFTFNTLNSIASLIYLEDREAAYDYMTKFTELLRGMLNDAEHIYRSLAEELKFLTTYLDLEKLRFGEKFTYKIEIGPGVNQKAQVPKLVLHTFAENSIKHGIIPKAEDGLLIIRVDNENNYLKLTIEDNGIGREASTGQSTSTGKGLKITGEFYDILNQINKRHIKHLITDLYNETGTPAGTRVEVWVPVDEV